MTAITTVQAQTEAATKELNGTIANKTKIMEQLASYEQVRNRGNHIPNTLNAIFEQIASRANEVSRGRSGRRTGRTGRRSTCARTILAGFLDYASKSS